MGAVPRVEMQYVEQIQTVQANLPVQQQVVQQPVAQQRAIEVIQQPFVQQRGIEVIQQPLVQQRGIEVIQQPSFQQRGVEVFQPTYEQVMQQPTILRGATTSLIGGGYVT